MCRKCLGLKAVQRCVCDATGWELIPCPLCGTWDDVRTIKATLLLAGAVQDMQFLDKVTAKLATPKREE